MRQPHPSLPARGKVPRLLALSVVPISFGAYAPAVQLVGALSDPQAILLQCGTYAVAAAAFGALRLLRDGDARVGLRTWRAGIELGSLVSLAATLEILGLQRTSAARAGFIVRLSTVIVPVVEAARRRQWPSTGVSMAVGCSLVGLVLMVISPGAAQSAHGAGLLGDGLMALAALLYSWHIMRLSDLAPRSDAWKLATAKAATQLVLSQVRAAAADDDDC